MGRGSSVLAQQVSEEMDVIWPAVNCAGAAFTDREFDDQAGPVHAGKIR